MKNCRSRRMYNAEPNMLTAHSGVSVSMPAGGKTLPVLSQIRNVGIRVTEPGSIIVARTTPKSTFRNGNRKYANANDVSAELIVTVEAARNATTVLLNSHDRTGATCQIWR